MESNKHKSLKKGSRTCVGPVLCDMCFWARFFIHMPLVPGAILPIDSILFQELFGFRRHLAPGSIWIQALLRFMLLLVSDTIYFQAPFEFGHHLDSGTISNPDPFVHFLDSGAIWLQAPFGIILHLAPGVGLVLY